MAVRLQCYVSSLHKDITCKGGCAKPLSAQGDVHVTVAVWSGLGVQTRPDQTIPITAARFDEDEVYALPQRSQPTRFIESALPLHSRAEYSTTEKRSASETSQKSTLPADHRAYIRASINNGWKKLNEYYDKLGESPLFAAAIILHPRFGISWLEATWVSEEQRAWVRDAKVGVKDYFTSWYNANQGLCEETMKYDAAPRTMGREDDPVHSMD
ncbi:Uncharacterized protein HZ326_31859 [Fusarium oxysporum f. sp. albedinis]|nr:Uncharacterized protein HZ326_31859 [Fusarium oxysporum f. sp. albedinis]